MPFWPNIELANKQKDEIEEIEKKIQELRENPDIEDKENVIKQLEESKPRPVEEPTYALKLDDDKKVHFILWGPEGCGKTQLAKSIAKKHERGIVNMSELLDWNIAHKTEAAEKAQTYLEARKGEIDAYVAEKEKERKKKKTKSKEDEGQIPTDHFNWVNHEMIQELLVERLKHQDCNAGAVFDNLKSRNYESELVAIKAIM